MPIIKFRGFTSASLVARSVAQGTQTASASTIWGIANAKPHASFTIAMADGNTDSFAPFGAVFRATGLTSFNVSEPAAPLTGVGSNAYDPTQHKISFIGDLDDAGYSPVPAPNVPTAWRNLNLAYGN